MRSNLKARGQVASALVLAWALSCAVPGPPARAQTATAPSVGCGASLEAPFRDRWLALGGAEGRLGCPSGEASSAAPSPEGVTGRQALFVNGAILLHGGGPRAGQAFAVDGCMFRLYFQFGGSGGRLGFPLGEAVNTPDGKRQAFEGGLIVWRRVSDTCAVEAAPAAEVASAPAGLTRLDLFEDGAGHAFPLASAPSAARAAAAGFRPVATLGYVFIDGGRGRAPLKTYWNSTTGDHDTIASAQSESADLAAGYEFAGLQGFVWTDPHPGAAALEHLWNPQTHMSLLVTGAAAKADAVGRGFVFVRIEGYVAQAP